MRVAVDTPGKHNEPASIDEFYLSLAGTEALYRHEPLAVTAARIRQDILTRTGMSVSFGGGSNRLIAKMAVEVAKPKPGTGRQGVFIVPDGGEAEFVAPLDLALIPGIGPRFAEILRRKGLVKAQDVLPLDRQTLELWFGQRTGVWLFDKVRGISRTPVVGRGDAKSVSRETTLSRDLRDPAELEAILFLLTTRVAGQLRDEGLVGRTVTLKLRHDDFHTVTRRQTLELGTDLDAEIYHAARGLFQQAFDGVRARNRGVRLIGVAVTNLGVAAEADLFESEERRRRRELTAAVDKVREKYGFSAVTPGAILRARRRRD